MKKSAYDLCKENKIEVRSHGYGVKYTTCPYCSSLRKPENRKKKVLRVTIDHLGIKWVCFHCSNHGYGFYSASKGDKDERWAKRSKHEDEPARSTGIRSGIGGEVRMLPQQTGVHLRVPEQRQSTVQKTSYMEQRFHSKTVGDSKTIMASPLDSRFAVPPKRSFGHDRR